MSKENKREEPKKRAIGVAEAITCVKLAKGFIDLIMKIIKRKKEEKQEDADKITENLVANYNKINEETNDQKKKEDLKDVKDDLNNMF
jgi:hypothetical protein